MSMRLITALALLFSIFVIYSVSSQTPIGMKISSFIGHIPYGDKSIHIVVMAALSFLFNLSFGGKKLKIGTWTFLMGGLLAGTLITIEEFSQIFISTRNFEFLDLVCNYAGVFVGSQLFALIPAFRSKENNDHQSETISIQAIFNRARPLRHESGDRRSSSGRMG